MPQVLQVLDPAPTVLPLGHNTARRPNPLGERGKTQIAPHSSRNTRPDAKTDATTRKRKCRTHCHENTRGTQYSPEPEVSELAVKRRHRRSLHLTSHGCGSAGGQTPSERGSARGQTASPRGRWEAGGAGHDGAVWMNVQGFTGTEWMNVQGFTGTGTPCAPPPLCRPSGLGKQPARMAAFRQVHLKRWPGPAPPGAARP